MVQKKEKLRPSLWRTVRAILNEQRLRLLRDVFAHDGEFCVSEIARRGGLEQPIASIYLRQMNARGLLGVRRDRIKVYYNTEPDRSLPESVRLQSVLKGFLRGKLERGWELKLMTVLRAFSHFNRLAILCRLADGPSDYGALSSAMGVCVKSFYHHLHYLRCADLVDVAFRDGKGVFVLRRPAHPIAVCLLDILLTDRDASAVYFNAGSGRRTDDAERAVLVKTARAEGNSNGRWREKKTMKSRAHTLGPSVRKALSQA